tara:strand:- start:1354 stop:2892 length:1539 start_codon:yes stop_codon:yes gene_type:complete
MKINLFFKTILFLYCTAFIKSENVDYMKLVFEDTSDLGSHILKKSDLKNSNWKTFDRFTFDRFTKKAIKRELKAISKEVKNDLTPDYLILKRIKSADPGNFVRARYAAMFIVDGDLYIGGDKCKGRTKYYKAGSLHPVFNNLAIKSKDKVSEEIAELLKDFSLPVISGCSMGSYYNRTPDWDTHAFVGLLISNFYYNHLYYEFYDLDSFTNCLETITIEPPSSFLKDIEKLKKEISNLDSIFMGKLAPVLANSLSPYTQEKWVTTSTDYDYDMYNLYVADGAPSWLAKEWSRVNYGHNEEYSTNQHLNVKLLKEVTPSWDEIKKFYGGIDELINRGITKDHINQFTLKYYTKKIEFIKNEEKYLPRIRVYMSSGKLGKEFWADKVPADWVEDYNGDVEITYDNPYRLLNLVYNNEKKLIRTTIEDNIFIECSFSIPYFQENSYKAPFSSLQNIDNYKNEFSKLYTLYWDEIETIFTLDEVAFLEEGVFDRYGYEYKNKPSKIQLHIPTSTKD